MPDQLHIIDSKTLHRFIENIFTELHVTNEDARIAADVVIEAELRGFGSHGLGRLLYYVKRLRAGLIDPNPDITVHWVTETTGQCRGGNGLGMVVGYKAMRACIERARKFGAAFLSVNRSNHFGIAGYYSSLALEHDMIGIAMTNASPRVVPTGGTTGKLGTNPLSVAIPRKEGVPFILDMSTSVVSSGRIDVVLRKGEKVPDGWLYCHYDKSKGKAKMKTVHILPVLALAASWSCSKQRQELEETFSNYEVAAVRAQAPVTVDGLLNEPVWQVAQRLPLKDSDTGEEVTDSSFSAHAFTSYDNDNLYVGFVCYDRDIYSNFTERDQHLWEEEAVEVFIDCNDEPKTYVEIEVSPNNVLFDSYIVDPTDIDVDQTSRFDLAGIRTAVFVDGTVDSRGDTDKSWSVEIAVPFASLVQDDRPAVLKDAIWRINFYRIDRDADGPVHYAWSPTKGRFHKPSVFGTLRFR